MRFDKGITMLVAFFLMYRIVLIEGEKSDPYKDFTPSEGTEEFNDPSEFGGLPDMQNYIKKEKHEKCHDVALHKCGKTFLTTNKLLTYLSDEETFFETRCGVRKAFYECLKASLKKICSMRHQPAYTLDPKFQKQLTEALWATRVCLLGVKNTRPI